MKTYTVIGVTLLFFSSMPIIAGQSQSTCNPAVENTVIYQPEEDIQDEPLCRSQTRLREYPNDETSPVFQHYKNMRSKQTLAYVLLQKKKYSNLHSYIALSIQEALQALKNFVDPSDPDVELSNNIHNYQTAERCRKLLPNEDWFHLVGLIHDIGKILYTFDEPTWAIVGDTFPVGHPFSQKCIYPDLFKDNTDYGNATIYEEHYGFDNVHFSWGHDEYMYHVLRHNKTTLPEEALYIIRYHSFYPWHQHGAYAELASEKDIKMIKYLKLFNQCDLYSKTDDVLDYESIKGYYDKLIKKYLPAKLKFFKPTTQKFYSQYHFSVFFNCVRII